MKWAIIANLDQESRPFFIDEVSDNSKEGDFYDDGSGRTSFLRRVAYVFDGAFQNFLRGIRYMGGGDLVFRLLNEAFCNAFENALKNREKWLREQEKYNQIARGERHQATKA